MNYLMPVGNRIKVEYFSCFKNEENEQETCTFLLRVYRKILCVIKNIYPVSWNDLESLHQQSRLQPSHESIGLIGHFIILKTLM